MVTKIDDQQIWVINHMAQKTVRQDISAEFRVMVDRLDNLDTQDFNWRLEKEANAFEEAFMKLLTLVEEDEEQAKAEDQVEKEKVAAEKANAPKVPIFDFRVKY